MRNLLRILYIFLMLLAAGCGSVQGPDSRKEEPRARGDIISQEIIASYAAAGIQGTAAGFGFSGLPRPADSVSAVRLTYYTAGPGNDLTAASGALIVPLNEGAHPLLSLHHGTEMMRSRVASINPMNSAEGFIGLVTATAGYVTCVPDYLGLGVSDCIHPYHHASLSAGACLDFLRAASSWCRDNGVQLDGRLFLGGYSEGGYVTMALHREIEAHASNEFTVTASAPMAGAHDMTSTAAALFSRSEYGSPAYLAFIITGYNDIYGWDSLNVIFKPPWAAQMPMLFDGTRSQAQINSTLPQRIDSLFTQSFLELVLSGRDSYISRALQENTLLDWAPAAPIRMYHGTADETVPFQNSLTALDNLGALSSASVELIPLSGLDHGGGALPAVLGAFTWFESFTATLKPRPRRAPLFTPLAENRR